MPSMKLREEALRGPVLAEIVSNLVEAYEPLTIYLFGSKARGEAGPDSDYDLMVIVPDDATPERRRSRLAYERLSGYRQSCRCSGVDQRGPCQSQPP